MTDGAGARRLEAAALMQAASLSAAIPMGKQDLVASLIYSAYRTIHEPAHWSPILRELQQMLHAQACDLSIYDFQTGNGEIAVHTGCYDGTHLRLYRRHFASLNPWMQRDHCYRADDGWCFGRQIVPHSRLLESAFYDGWLRPQGLFHRLSAVVAREGARVIYVSLLRERGAGSFVPEDCQPLRCLLPHLRQSLQLVMLLAGPKGLATAPLAEVASRLRGAPERESASPAATCDNEERLARLYRMTPAEARLAMLLAGGLSLAKTADLLGVSMATVRTHLQRIYGKTFTHHQAQLVSLLLLGPARIQANYQAGEDEVRDAG